MRVLISVFVVSVKRQVEPERGAATTGRVSSSDADYDDDGEDYDDYGEDSIPTAIFDSGDSDYAWLERDDFSSNRHHAQNDAGA
jgi:hypothetical protein